MASQLNAWLSSSEAALKTLKKKIKETKEFHETLAKKEKDLKAQAEKTKKMLEAKAGNHHQGRLRKHRAVAEGDSGYSGDIANW
eukprot:CAMPEP_0184482350 /NCGR_PEP_ID=MMETSP0113_2-20130426/3915_1 /TAXON_ID=91329 /ORGANISM="Norrisiella sphaerica, Strain BC52" /LENGTH=83 /DNA_ID=CAMNT_0026862023 /DNA_START=462 /DNA_END=710 /DNA_ORIENTATION=+